MFFSSAVSAVLLFFAVYLFSTFFASGFCNKIKFIITSSAYLPLTYRKNSIAYGTSSWKKQKTYSPHYLINLRLPPSVFLSDQYISFLLYCCLPYNQTHLYHLQGIRISSLSLLQYIINFSS